MFLFWLWDPPLADGHVIVDEYSAMCRKWNSSPSPPEKKKKDTRLRVSLSSENCFDVCGKKPCWRMKGKLTGADSQLHTAAVQWDTVSLTWAKKGQLQVDHSAMLAKEKEPNLNQV